jgi:hypothetical protein
MRIAAAIQQVPARDCELRIDGSGRWIEKVPAKPWGSSCISRPEFRAPFSAWRE